MGARGASLGGVLAAVLIAGCGGGHKSTTHSSTASSASTAAASGIAAHVLVTNELAGFTGSTPTVATSVASWVSSNGPPPGGTAAEQKRLTALGFVRGASENLTGGATGTTGGLSEVEQFRSPKEAQAEVDYEANSFTKLGGNSGAQFKTFAVPGIPRARSFAALGPGSGGGGINIAFAKGTYAYVVGQEIPSASSYAVRVKKLTAAAQHLYGRVSSS
jgi:hypothetical protein